MTRTPTLCLCVALLAFPAAAEQVIQTPTAGAAHVEMFRADMAAKAQWAADQNKSAVPGADGWLFLPAELTHIAAGEFWGERAAEVSTATKPEWADPLPAIVDFHKQLEALGVELLFVAVPPKAVIYPEQVSGVYNEKIAPNYPSTPRLDTADAAFYDELRKHGVHVIDLTPDLLALKSESDQPVYCAQDTHWSAPAVKLTAQKIRQVAAQRDWYKPAEAKAYQTQDRTVELTGDLWQTNRDATLPKESITLTYVGEPGTDPLAPVADDPASPVLLLGDSHLLVFHVGGDMHTVGAGLAEHTARELGRPVDVIGVRGSGATPCRVNLIRKAYRDPAYLTDKKLVVWVLTAREFTQTTGWRMLPVTKDQ